MVDQAVKLDQALALGFSSVEECGEHQKWLERQAEQRVRIRAAVQAANESGSPIIDIRLLGSE